MRGNPKHENREIRSAYDLKRWRCHQRPQRSANVYDAKADMNADRKSDDDVVPMKPVNNDATEASAESAEERSSVKRSAPQEASHRTQDRTKRESRGLWGVREAARKDSQLKFTTLLHHVNEDCLREAFYHVKRSAAVGVDGVTWAEYEQNVETNIAELHDRIHRGGYRAKPSRRVWIPKADGRQRPLGIASLEDKIVQQAVLWVLQSIYEQDFLGFSYGFRPGRGTHQALDALSVAITSKKVNWILDADVEGFFDAIDHQWLIKFLEHRIGDRRILRLIRKWLHAGIIEEGVWERAQSGSPQGSVISPLLANIYLHYVLDLWIEWWRRHCCHHDVVIVRYADDFVIGFESRSEAVACLEALQERFAKFGLKLHKEKTRLIEFGRFAIERRIERGEGRPATFDFLGLTHICAKTRRRGWFTIHRHTAAKRMRATLGAIKQSLRTGIHRPLGETGRWLGRVVRGWLNYHAVPSNSRRLKQFVDTVTRLWLRVIRRRSQRGRDRWTWARMAGLRAKYLPLPRILHPYPQDRFRARLKAGAV